MKANSKQTAVKLTANKIVTHVYGCPISMPFLLTCIDVRTVKFFWRLLNPDWSIQISGAPAVCKAVTEVNYF